MKISSTYRYVTMRSIITRRIRLFILILFYLSLVYLSVNIRAADNNALLTLQKMRYTTDAYKNAATDALLDDVNRITLVLQLPEKRPLQTNDLVDVAIASPFMSQNAGHFGCIRSKLFSYCASVDNKLSFIEKVYTNGDVGRLADLEEFKRSYSLPKAEMKTNSAFALATNWLAAAGMDVIALNKACKIDVRVLEFGNRFVPLFRFRWRLSHLTGTSSHSDEKIMDTVATVELFEPERSLRVLRVESPRYILSHPLVVPDVDRLLEQPGDSQKGGMWFTTDAYRKAALDIMLREVNTVARRINLSDRLPIRSSDLIRTNIETPFFSDHQGQFATVTTKYYVYGANASNKLSYINQNFKCAGNDRYLSDSLRVQYGQTETQISTNSAHEMAKQWLSAVSTDVTALERDCVVNITFDTFNNHAIPFYEVIWQEADGSTAATVDLLLPERHLIKLWVQDPKYLNSKALVISDRERLLGQ